MKKPIVVTATQAELDALLALAKQFFPIAQYELLKGGLCHLYLCDADPAKRGLDQFNSSFKLLI